MLTRREVLVGTATTALTGSPARADDPPGGDPASRLVTAPMLDDDPPALRVSWIQWDSPFRGSGLRIGDQIVAINGAAVARPTTLAQRQHASQTSIGLYAEAQGFAETGLGVGSPVALTLRRRRPVAGWQTVAATARLGTPSVAIDAGGNRLLGSGGPDEMVSDGFDSGWGGWDERIVREYSQILDGGWDRSTFANRVELRLHAERRPRVDFLTRTYPGPYAAAAQADWDAVQACLAGDPVTLAPNALDYRRAEDERVQQVRSVGQAAWQAAQDAVASAALPAFPALHPIRGDYAAVVGRIVVLPPLGNQDWITEAGHGWFAAGSDSENWYFIDAEGRRAIAMLRARQRFERLVSPNVAPSFAFIGRIAAQPKLLVFEEQARFGLQLDPIAALVGEAMFVDLAGPDAEPPFAGEAAFHQPEGALPPPDASPAEVMAALVVALKNNDQLLWNALFADWLVDRLPDGQVLLTPYLERASDEDWTRARASILGRVYDARVLWTGDAVVVTDGAAYPGAPRIERVDVLLDHIGHFDDGYGVFTDTTVNRAWQLQRVNGGPWRIHSVQSI